MVFHLEYLSTLKSVAKVIERKYPGSCTDFIKTIDEIQNSPAYMKERSKELYEKWVRIRSELQPEESPTETENPSFDITDISSWEEFTTRHIWETGNNNFGVIESIFDTLKEAED